MIWFCFDSVFRSVGNRAIVIERKTKPITPMPAVASTAPIISAAAPKAIIPMGPIPKMIILMLRTRPRIESGTIICTCVKLLVMKT